MSRIKSSHLTASEFSRDQPRESRPWFNKERLSLAGLVLVAVGASATGCAVEPELKPSVSAPSDGASDAEPTEDGKPDMTSGQKNALRAAKNYLDIIPHSRKGLIEQLSSDAGDGYTVKEAMYGVDKVGL